MGRIQEALNNREDGRIAMAARAVAAIALLTNGCTTAHGEVAEKKANDAIVADFAPAIPPTTIPETTTTIETTSTTTTTTAPPETTTTTTLGYNPEESVEPFTTNGCDEGNTLTVHLQGPAGEALDADIGIDHMVGNQKVDLAGNPIEHFVGYSKFLRLNHEVPESDLVMGGIKSFCLENLPNGRTFVEVYTYDSNQSHADIMSHGIYTAPGRHVYLTSPRVCQPEQGIGGSTGTIEINPSYDGSPVRSDRAVAWAHFEGTFGHAYGFGAEDVKYNGTNEERKVGPLVANQDYLTQFHIFDNAGNEHVVVADHVPSYPCDTTFIDVNVSSASEQIDHCNIRSSGSDLPNDRLRCTVDQEYIG